MNLRLHFYSVGPPVRLPKKIERIQSSPSAAVDSCTNAGSKSSKEPSTSTNRRRRARMATSRNTPEARSRSMTTNCTCWRAIRSGACAINDRSWSLDSGRRSLSRIRAFRTGGRRDDLDAGRTPTHHRFVSAEIQRCSGGRATCHADHARQHGVLALRVVVFVDLNEHGRAESGADAKGCGRPGGKSGPWELSEGAVLRPKAS